MPTLMRGAAIVFGTLATGVNAFGERRGACAGCGAGVGGCCGGGALVHATARQTNTANRFMKRAYAKTRASLATPSRMRSSGSLAKVSRRVLRPLPSTKNGAPGT